MCDLPGYIILYRIDFLVLIASTSTFVTNLNAIRLIYEVLFLFLIILFLIHSKNSKKKYNHHFSFTKIINL